MQRIRNMAYEFFVQQGLELPLDFKQLSKAAKNMGWKIHAYSETEELIKFLESHGHPYIRGKKGFTYKPRDRNDPSRILYSDELSCMEKVAVISHEIGHIVTGHTSLDGVLGKSELRFIENSQEKEAKIFALELQAPIPLLQKMRILSADMIVEFGILNRVDAIKQIMHMRKRDISKGMGSILAFVMLFVTLWGGIMLGRGILDNGNAPTETTTAYVKQAGNFGGITAEIALDDESKTKLVYVTKSGEKYHQLNCQHTKYKNNLTELTLDDALGNGYEACSVCRPDLD